MSKYLGSIDFSRPAPPTAGSYGYYSVKSSKVELPNITDTEYDKIVMIVSHNSPKPRENKD